MSSESICTSCMIGHIINGKCTNCGKESEKKHYTSVLPVGWKLKKGRYFIGDVLGSGGYGITYAAWDYRQNRRVAIKEYYPKSIAVRDGVTYELAPTVGKHEEYEHAKMRFLQEAQILHRMQNVSNVLKIFDLFDEMGTAYYAMEYLEGCTLQQNVRKNGPMNWDRLALPTGSILTALEQIHAYGLFHRDISPDNIILLPDYSARLIDFGSVRNYIKDDHFTISVKKQFSPCEMWQSNSQQGPWTDVFSLGATLYFCLTGILPASSIQRLSSVQINGTDPLGSITQYCTSVPDNVQNAIEKALSLKASDRYGSAYEFKRALFPIPELNMGANLICFHGIMSGSIYRIHSGSILTMGRAADNDIRYPDGAKLISRYHCSIYQNSHGEVYLRDDDSSNGTFLNGKRLLTKQWVRLVSGDRFRIADEVYTIQSCKIPYR